MPRAQLSFVHRYVPNSDPANALTLLLLHGTGGNEDDLIPLGHELAPGAGLLSPRGKVLENGMPRFFRRFAEGVFDEADVAFRARELADFVEAAAETYGFDAKRVVAVGYSNGANIAAAMLLLRPEVLDGAVLFRAMLPLAPPAALKLSGKRILLAAGRRDPFVSRMQTDGLAAVLAASGADLEMQWTDGGHALAPEEIAASREWLQSQFGMEEAA
jgi:predicted esterase